ncbi:MAG: hypothetical protein HY075_00930 [Deltaproteobacteria bacterium]|nr:hypothetical protein [Deltaproteobacteria bacterium]
MWTTILTLAAFGVAHASAASLIVTPETHPELFGAEPAPKVLASASRSSCRVWLTPPSVVRRAVQIFFSRAAMRLMPIGQLQGPAARALDLMSGAASDKLRIKVKDDAPSELELHDGALTLSAPAADRLLKAAELDPTELVDTGAKLDQALASRLLDVLPTGASNAWDELATRTAWRQAFEHPGTAQPTPPAAVALAEKLWPIVNEARKSGDPGPVAEAFGRERSRAIEERPSVLSEPARFDALTLRVLLEQGEYRALFLELGARAAELAAATKMVADGALKQAEGAKLVAELQARFDEACSILAKKFSPGLILLLNAPATRAQPERSDC